MPVQVVPPKTVSSRQPRTSSTPRRPAAPKNAPPMEDVNQQRLYHVTHVDNLAGILEAHAIFADASHAWEARPAIDIAAPSTRDTRRHLTVTELGDAPVAEYVPFALTPDASFWSSIRAGEEDTRLSPEVSSHSAADFVVLVSSVKSVREGKPQNGSIAPQLVLAETDAADALTRFAATPDEFTRLLSRLRAAPDSAALLEAEILVHDSLSFDSVSLIGVANDKVREVVRRMLDDSGYEHRVAVYPPWYTAA